ncbi:three component ABC system middle component [Vibrio cholerae]|uniref:three component ABC system middle component n=1 Tax=Vibrio cholerae TaxID=666 RepID=UPI000BA8F5E0|nr:three component ABC system middle component [Vibrio cholerae]PAS29116.1 hypothetical protein CGT71_13200 [Vibrio cholerae]
MNDYWGSEYSDEEIANYNPFYVGFIILNFIKAYTDVSKRSVSSNLIFLAVPMSLTSVVSYLIPKSVSTSLDKWAAENDSLMVSVPYIIESVAPFIVSSLYILEESKNIIISEDGFISVNSKSKMLKDDGTITPSMKEAIRASRLLGKWFAKSDSEASVFSRLGVKP